MSEWQWRQLGRMQVCTLLQTDNHASTIPLVFYRPDALPAAQPTVSKHWRQSSYEKYNEMVQGSNKNLFSIEINLNSRLTRCPGGGETICPPADGSSTVAYRFAAICVSPWIRKSRRIYVRPRTGHSPHISGGQQWLSCRQPACL